MEKRGPDDEGYILLSQKDTTPRAYHGESTDPRSREFHKELSNALDHLEEKGHVGLAHRRLSIIDLSPRGFQPMASENGRFWIVYNGEIYNFQELRKELVDHGYSFFSQTDTEVLLKAYIQWGEEMLHRLNGMFAFCIYDQEKEEVFLARDRIGIKPLYYTVQEGNFIFGSDIKTLIASGYYDSRVNLEGLWHNLSLDMAPRPMTSFEEIQGVKPGNYLKIELSKGKIEKQEYWNVHVGQQEERIQEEEAIEELEEAIKRAVDRRLISDTEVGTFMSGGIDSTTVSAIAGRYQKGIKAFTLGYSDGERGDEVQEAIETAQMNGLHHIVERISADSILPEHIEEMVEGYEEPFPTLSPNFLISKLVNEHKVKVILNGLGGDELFCGYSYYPKRTLWYKARKFRHLLKMIPNVGDRRVELLKALGKHDRVEEYYTLMRSYMTRTEKEKGLLFNISPDHDSLSILSETYPLRKGSSFTDDLEGISYYDLKHYIGNHHLPRGDQFTMNFSIEGRFPFLDHELIETAMKMPSHLKLKNGKGKYVLRKVAEKYISPSCLSMNKTGFSLPMKQWMGGKLREFTYENIRSLQKRDLINEKRVEHEFSKYRKTGKDHQRIWQLVMLELWFKKFIDDSGGAVA